MRYCKLSIALLCMFASNSFALDIITSSENDALLDIQQKHDVDRQLISANDKLSLYNQSQYEYKALAQNIESDKKNYEKLISALPGQVLSSSNTAEYFQEIKKLIINIDKLERLYVTAGVVLKEESQILATDYENLNELRTQKNIQLSLLKKKVVERLVNDLSKPSSIQKINIDGETVCSKFQSIADCLNENESRLISKTKKTEPFLNDRSVLLSYKVQNASMNMDGVLNYSISMSFKPSYNNKVEALLNDKFGLKSAVITLESNVDAEWYIDGNKVGEGKKIQHEVTLGRHGILASYKSHDQSTVEMVEGNGQFSYIFQNNVTPPLLKSNELETKVVGKQKSTPEINGIKSKSSNDDKNVYSAPIKVENKTNKKVVNDKDKDYLYFMGIEAESPEQKRSFSE